MNRSKKIIDRLGSWLQKRPAVSYFVLSLSFSLTLSSVFPYLFSAAFRTQPEKVEIKTETLGFGASHPCETLKLAPFADISIKSPSVIEKSGGFVVELSLLANKTLMSMCPELYKRGFSISVRLSSSGMIVLPSEAAKKLVTNEQTWIWTGKSSEAGDFLLDLEFADSDGGELDFERIVAPKQVKLARNKHIILPIKVLTDLGLTARDERMLQVLGAILGLCAAFMASDLFRRFLEKVSRLE